MLSAAAGRVAVDPRCSLGFRGLNLGIDFEGGTAWEVPDLGS